jgi:hypothetical protein
MNIELGKVTSFDKNDERAVFSFEKSTGILFVKSWKRDMMVDFGDEKMSFDISPYVYVRTVVRGIPLEFIMMFQEISSADAFWEKLDSEKATVIKGGLVAIMDEE